MLAHTNAYIHGWTQTDTRTYIHKHMHAGQYAWRPWSVRKSVSQVATERYDATTGDALEISFVDIRKAYFNGTPHPPAVRQAAS